MSNSATCDRRLGYEHENLNKARFDAAIGIDFANRQSNTQGAALDRRPALQQSRLFLEIANPRSRPGRSFRKSIGIFYFGRLLCRIFYRRQPLIEFRPMKLSPVPCVHARSFMHELREDFLNTRFLNRLAHYANLF
jgi:hypothetical protein